MQRILPALVVLVVLFDTAHGEQPDVTRLPTIDVRGSGTVPFAPKMAILQLNISSEGKVASEALDKNRKETQSLLALLKNKGIAPDDIRTKSINAVPRHGENIPVAPLAAPFPPQLQPVPGPQPDQHEIDGFHVSHSLLIVIHKLDSLGEIVDAVVLSGPNRLQNISYTTDNFAKSQNEARKLAIEDARRAAEELATNAGMKVGRPLHIQDVTRDIVSTGYDYVPAHPAMSHILQASFTAASESMVTSQVHVSYELLPANDK